MKVRNLNNNYATARVKINISKQFFGWLSGLYPDVWIKSPSDVKQQYNDYLKGIINFYKNEMGN